ncbi:MAG: sensor histidine kinase [Frankia sp.]
MIGGSRGERLGWLVVAGTLPLTAAALAIDIRDGLTWRTFVTGDPGFSVVLATTLPLLGAAVRRREPGSRLAWVFSSVGLAQAVFVAATAWTNHAYVVDPGSWSGGGFASWVAFWARLPAAALAPLTLLWFPDGRPPGHRWRRASIPSGVALAAVALLAALSWSFRGPRLLPDAPVPPGAQAQIAAACFPVLAAAAVTGLAFGLASLVIRLRSRDPVVRAQVKWYLYGGVAGVALNLSGDVLGPGTGLNMAGTLASEAAILIAVERYRLWSIDRLINRTLVYGTLTALAAATYAGCAAGLGLLLAGIAHGQSVAVAGATLAAAAFVAPARQTVQTRIDRWFDRRAFDAVARVRAFAHRLGTAQPAPGELREVLADALHDPSLSLLFTLADGRIVDPAGALTTAPPADRGRVVHRLSGGGGDLGWLEHRPMPTHEAHLLGAVLAAAALPLEYARLQAELRVHLAAVEASRARIVEAADGERRRIERNLHDGAQQRLVALAVQLRTEQRRLGPTLDPRIPPVLDLAVSELRDAVAELRALAQGLLPAALASEGLGPALRELVDRQHAGARLLEVPDHRHGPALEATGWFVAAEGLANAAKHAPGAAVTVTATCRGTTFTIVIADLGPGGATIGTGSGLRGLADRVDTRGGRLTVRSPPGGGTDLRAELPCG